MITKRTTRGRYLGSGEEFIIEDDYADPVNAHRVLANAWVGTTRVFEERAADIGEDVNEGNEGEKKFKEAWADVDFDECPSAEERREVNELSCLSVSVRGSGDSHFTSDANNGPGRQAVGVARSAASKRPSAVLPQVARPVRSLPDCVVSPCRPRSVMHESASAAQTVAEGECKSDGTHSQMDCTITEARMSRQAGRQFIGVYSNDRVLMNHHCVAQGETLKILFVCPHPFLPGSRRADLFAIFAVHGSGAIGLINLSIRTVVFDPVILRFAFATVIDTKAFTHPSSSNGELARPVRRSRRVSSYHELHRHARQGGTAFAPH